MLSNPQNLSPQLPLLGVEYLHRSLKIGSKYLLLHVGASSNRLARLFSKLVYAVFVLPDTPETQTLLEAEQQVLANSKIELVPTFERLGADVLDFALVEYVFLQRTPLEGVREQLKKVLRLNSYVVVLSHRLLVNSAFADAYTQMLANQQLKDAYFDNKNEQETQLTAFFEQGFQSEVFPNQTRFSLEQFLAYIQNSQPPEKFPVLQRGAKILYQQFQQHGYLVLDYETRLDIGLFNKNVPAISLRKSIFFHLLRPFAFGFYLLVKLNVYFWRALLGRK